MTEDRNVLSLVSAWLRNEENAETKLNNLLEENDLPKISRKVFVPTVGDNLKLVTPWKATIESERRNTKFLESTGLDLTTSLGK